jgi:hypothetical protein
VAFRIARDAAECEDLGYEFAHLRLGGLRRVTPANETERVRPMSVFLVATSGSSLQTRMIKKPQAVF